MMKIRTYPTLLLVIMGSMDCLTTAVGILYFGDVELNPVIASVISTNMLVFVLLKLTATALICLIFIHAEKILMTSQNKTARSFSMTHKLLKLAYAGVAVFMTIIVANNTLVLVHAIPAVLPFV